jgi:hypothetical protein
MTTFLATAASAVFTGVVLLTLGSRIPTAALDT